MSHKFDTSDNPWPDIYPDIKLPGGVLTAEDEEILLKYSGGMVIDLGTHKGRSAAILSIKAKHVYTIDEYRQIGQIPDYNYECSVKNLEPFENVTPINGKTEHFHVDTPDVLYDVVFVDADHRYEPVKKDFGQWYPRVKAGGIIIFHDYILADPNDEGLMRGVQVKQFVDEILEQKLVQKAEQTGLCMVVQK
jgi:predicted O-methyltransferase YrrM